MSDMFGAPIGIGAAETDMRQNVLGALKATEELGKIAMQPAQQKLLEAQAAEHAAKAGDLEAMQKLEQGLAASRLAARQGQVLTVGDLPKGTDKAPSLADPLLELLNYGKSVDASPRILAPVAKEAAGILQKEASAGSAQAEQQLRILDANFKRAERIGELAQMGLQGPQQLAQARLLAAQEGLPQDRLPQDFFTAAPMLEGLVASSMKAKDLIRIKQREIEDADKARLHKSMEARNYAGAKLAGARLKLAEQTYDYKAKFGGETSQAAIDAKKSMERRRDVLNLKELDVSYPQAPLDPKLRKEGQSYRTADGQFFKWVKDPTDGKMKGLVITTPPGVKTLLQKGGIAPAAEVEGEGEDMDEGEEE